jgi:hypothetical protein
VLWQPPGSAQPIEHMTTTTHRLMEALSRLRKPPDPGFLCDVTKFNIDYE